MPPRIVSRHKLLSLRPYAIERVVSEYHALPTFTHFGITLRVDDICLLLFSPLASATTAIMSDFAAFQTRSSIITINTRHSPQQVMAFFITGRLLSFEEFYFSPSP